jgi:hypothetical protein
MLKKYIELPTIVVRSCFGSDRFSTLTCHPFHSIGQTFSSGTRPGKLQMRHDQVCDNSDFQAQGDHNADGEFEELQQFPRILPPQAFENAGKRQLVSRAGLWRASEEVIKNS